MASLPGWFSIVASHDSAHNGRIGFILDYLVDVVILGPQWTEGFKALGHDGFSSSQLIGSSLTGPVGGNVAVWIYVGIRPRFGAGLKTAIYAGLAVWIVGILLPNIIFMRIFGPFWNGWVADNSGSYSFLNVLWTTMPL